MEKKPATNGNLALQKEVIVIDAAERPEFLKMIRQCRQKKIDLVLVKSISRFARNTVDCLNYIRALRQLGIAVVFEKENINTLESDSEMLITMMGAFAQAESESMSQNIRWGKRQAMREGRINMCYHRLYAYEKGEDGLPRIIPEQAEVVRRIYKSFLAGQSLRMIKEWLERERITAVGGGTNFETLMDEALRLMREEGFENADVVFITDGKCALSKTYLKQLQQEQAARRFTLTGILLDQRRAGMEFSLAEFCQNIYRTSELTGEEVVKAVIRSRV